MRNKPIPFVWAAFLSLAGVAYADDLPEMPVNPPSECASILNQISTVSFRIPAANCLAKTRMDLVSLTTANLETANDLAAAVAPSMALLDNVITLNDPALAILAEDAKRDIYRNMEMRLRRAVQPDDEVGQIRVDMLVANWRDNVDLATMRVVAMAEKNPEIVERDSVIGAIAKSANEDASQVATRSRR